jgi:hypothetical protein
MVIRNMYAVSATVAPVDAYDCVVNVIVPAPPVKLDTGVVTLSTIVSAPGTASVPT